MKKPSRAARESVSVITKHYKKMNKEKILLFDTFQTLAGLGFSVNIMRQTAGELPANPDALPDGRIPAAYVIDDDEVYLWNDSASEWVKTDLIQARSFGSILGDPSDNTALQTALDGKAGLNTENTFEEDQFFSGHIRDINDGVTIQDDSVYLVPRTPHLVGVLLISARNSGYSHANALINYRHTTNRYVRIMAQSSDLWEGASIGGVPSDTEGVDGKITLYASGDGNLYINNRFGGLINIHINRFGR